jgi:hypothetical protein
MHALRDGSDSAMPEKKRESMMTPPDSVDNRPATSYSLEDNKSVK